MINAFALSPAIILIGSIAGLVMMMRKERKCHIHLPGVISAYRSSIYITSGTIIIFQLGILSFFASVAALAIMLVGVIACFRSDEFKRDHARYQILRNNEIYAPIKDGNADVQSKHFPTGRGDWDDFK